MSPDNSSNRRFTMQTQHTLFDQMVKFFLSAFQFPGLNWKLVAISVLLGLGFGALWLSAYVPRLRNKISFILIPAASALVTWTAIAFIQTPLQAWTGQALLHFWNQFTILKWLLLAGIPSILLTGLVQEGAKLLPVVFFWLRRGRKLDAKNGLIAGALAGAGFGIFEAVWVYNTIFASGWTLQAVQTGGFQAMLGFEERFFTIGFHIAASALAGYGLAKGFGWQFFIIAALLHGATNYGVVLGQKGILNIGEIELYIAVITAVVTAVVLRLRWKAGNKMPDISSAAG